MDIFKQLFAQLGVNQTVFLQLVPFLVCYFFLSQFLFKPYRRTLELRKKSTGGSVEEATQLNLASERLAMDYQGKIKTQNEQAAALYERFKTEGHKEEERLLAHAREHGAQLIEKTKTQINTELNVAKDQLRAQLPQLSSLIASRVLGRDVV